MALHRHFATLLLAIAAGIASAADETPEKWNHDVGMAAPRLAAAGWLGTPVSLDALKGTTVVLAFWNVDVPWC